MLIKPQCKNSNSSAVSLFWTGQKLLQCGSVWVVKPQEGHYPLGSKLLKGTAESFVVSPLGSIVDEKYTAYFDFETS